jgi:hypothetical protein
MNNSRILLWKFESIEVPLDSTLSVLKELRRGSLARDESLIALNGQLAMLRVVADEFKTWLDEATIFPRLGYITGEQIGYGGAILFSLQRFIEKVLDARKTDEDEDEDGEFDYEELEMHEVRVSAVFHAIVSILGLKGL